MLVGYRRVSSNAAGMDQGLAKGDKPVNRLESYRELRIAWLIKEMFRSMY